MTPSRRFRISPERLTGLLQDRHRAPDGIINLGGTVDHILRRMEGLKVDRFGFRSSTPLLIARLCEDSRLSVDSQPAEHETEYREIYDLEVRLAQAICDARLLQLANAQEGYDSPRDALDAAFPNEFIEALRDQLQTIPFYLEESEVGEMVADLDISSCSALSGAIAVNVFAVDDDGSEIVFDEKPNRKISFREILSQIEKNADANPYDDDDWREWRDNYEPPFNDDA